MLKFVVIAGLDPAIRAVTSPQRLRYQRTCMGYMVKPCDVGAFGEMLQAQLFRRHFPLDDYVNGMLQK